MSRCFSDPMSMMMKYAITHVSLEQFGMDSMDDVKYDGYHSLHNKILVKF